MKAPTKQRSMKETKMAESRVDLRRKRVTIAQTAPRTETMKRVLRGWVLAFEYWVSRYEGSGLQDVARCELVCDGELVDEV